MVASVSAWRVYEVERGFGNDWGHDEAVETSCGAVEAHACGCSMEVVARALQMVPNVREEAGAGNGAVGESAVDSRMDRMAASAG